MNEASPSLTKYVLIFSAIYAVIMVVINILLHGFDIDVGSGANIAMLIGAGFGTATKFVNDMKRAPTKIEKNLLSLACMASSFLVSTAGMAAIIPVVTGETFVSVMAEILSVLPPLIWVVIALFVALFQYFILYLIFGWGVRKYAQKVAGSAEA